MKRERIKKHLIIYSVLLSEIIGLVSVLFLRVFTGNNFMNMLGVSLLLGILIIYPLQLTVINIVFLFWKTEEPILYKKGKQFEYITIILGFLYSITVLIPFDILIEIKLRADWTEVLYNSQLHTPIWTKAYITILVLSGIGIAGYLLLSCIRLNRMSPIVIVCAFSAMYLGILQCILWIVQIFSIGNWSWILCLCPFNCIIIAIKTIRFKILEWNKEGQYTEKVFKNRFLNDINQKLLNSVHWPVAAFLFMWPLLGILICILAIFGQQPDSIIKAWTETSDWNLSGHIAPQNVFYDEHYLCTVAAGGHKNIVKPLRLGVRHGHQVIVNRQLCIANAFEQILEEHVPTIHRHLRHFYDKYGFPAAKMIRSPYIADLIYFIMKPLEWVFLFVLYLCDVCPENRIAVQYMPKQISVGLHKLRSK